jgi:hypothetical protein
VVAGPRAVHWPLQPLLGLVVLAAGAMAVTAAAGHEVNFTAVFTLRAD